MIPDWQLLGSIFMEAMASDLSLPTATSKRKHPPAIVDTGSLLKHASTWSSRHGLLWDARPMILPVQLPPFLAAALPGHHRALPSPQRALISAMKMGASAHSKRLPAALGLDGYHAHRAGCRMDIFQSSGRTATVSRCSANIDCRSTLVFGPRKRSGKECAKRSAAAPRAGGYILSSSNSIHSGVPARNYLAMLEAAREHGTYPIGRTT